MLTFPTPQVTPRWRSALVSATQNSQPGSTRFGRVATLIIPRVYLSDYYTARDGDELSRLGITHVLSVLEQAPSLPTLILDNHKLHVSLADQPNADILSQLESTTTFIREALAENETNTVLVHCFQGISRSATIVCAYLVATMPAMTAAESIAFVKAKRGIVCPNTGFRRQLEVYATRFVGRRAAERAGRPSGKGVNKISGGIAERIRRLKTAGQSDSIEAKQDKDVVDTDS